jgi:translation initiation factor RLI1
MVEKNQYIQQIKDLHKRKTGNILSDTEAMNVFQNLITLLENVYGPITKEVFEGVSENYQIKQ